MSFSAEAIVGKSIIEHKIAGIFFINLSFLSAIKIVAFNAKSGQTALNFILYYCNI
jgi:hypothetical protein